MQKKNATLMNPKAAAGVVQPLNKNWYSIQAKANNQAEVWLYDEIGGWGVTARQFAQVVNGHAFKHITTR